MNLFSGVRVFLNRVCGAGFFGNYLSLRFQGAKLNPVSGNSTRELRGLGLGMQDKRNRFYKRLFVSSIRLFLINCGWTAI